MNLILFFWTLLLCAFTSVPASYFLYMRTWAKKPWRLKIDPNYEPTVTIMVPMYNEERTIELKLANLAKLKYPKKKLQILLIDDASTDGTKQKVSKIADKMKCVSLVGLDSHRGKIAALNKVFHQATGEIIVVSDADAFLAPDVLIKTVQYLADPSVGAVISKEKLLKSEASWVSKTEELYFKLVYGTLKLGESKIYSTITFHGGFAAYKKSFLSKFNVEADDTATALDIVQMGGRTLLVPEATSFGLEFLTWKDKIRTKIRRAAHNVKTWTMCLKLMFEGRLLLPKKIAIPQIYLYLFNPLAFLGLLVATPIVMYNDILYFVVIILILCFLLLFKRTRFLLIEMIQNNFFLMLGIATLFLGKKISRWKTAQDPRAVVTRSMLENEHLV